jgi:hypothetical protein
MRVSPVRLAFTFVTAAAAVWAGSGRGVSQDPDLAPTYGWVKLKSGFETDPFTVDVDSGGTIKTKLGGVTTYVDKAPDFRVKFTTGREGLPLIFRVKSKADTTLLINTPDGKWVANDDGDGGVNPKVEFRNPKAGQYDIWVGSFNGTVDPATLYITELR